MGDGYSKDPAIEDLKVQGEKLNTNIDSIDFNSLTLNDCVQLIVVTDFLKGINTLLEFILEDQRGNKGE